MYCNNCAKKGHIMDNCKEPITSIGIIGFKFDKEENINNNNMSNKKNIKYLMIQRRDTYGYFDFMRGKYNFYNLNYLVNIINEMTLKEKNKLLTHDFDTLWSELWGDGKLDDIYKKERTSSKNKFALLKNGISFKNMIITLKDIIDNSDTNWESPEWGFPKGRRDYQEREMTTALREFNEETGIPLKNVNVIRNINCYNEVFTSSNFKSYKHKYYLAKVDYGDNFKDYEKSEVSNLKWVSYNEAVSLIRYYNVEKTNILSKINKTLNTYSLIS